VRRKELDYILTKLMTTSGSYEDLFKKELGKYDLVSQEVARNIENQERLFRQIKMHNDAFAATFNLEDFKGQKEKAFHQVRAAVAKYREIRENINEGLKFYVTLQVDSSPIQLVDFPSSMSLVASLMTTRPSDQFLCILT
jgi:programmed cell death 6-interacting protein